MKTLKVTLFVIISIVIISVVLIRSNPEGAYSAIGHNVITETVLGVATDSSAGWKDFKMLVIGADPEDYEWSMLAYKLQGDLTPELTIKHILDEPDGMVLMLEKEEMSKCNLQKLYYSDGSLTEDGRIAERYGCMMYTLAANDPNADVITMIKKAIKEFGVSEVDAIEAECQGLMMFYTKN